jgi:hypothetical protein
MGEMEGTNGGVEIAGKRVTAQKFELPDSPGYREVVGENIIPVQFDTKDGK